MPTTVPNGCETVNGWLIEWSQERRSLERAEALLARALDALKAPTHSVTCECTCGTDAANAERAALVAALVAEIEKAVK